MSDQVLAVDIGGTKTAWAVVSRDGALGKRGEFATPQDREAFLTELREVVTKHSDVAAVGIGFPGTVNRQHTKTRRCMNVPALADLDLAEAVLEACGKPALVDNDGRCALCGESWLGAAADTTSAVMLTLGTGVGGAVKQRGTILPHPEDLSLEIGHLIADPADIYPAPSGQGSVESLIGGKNIEARYDVSLHELHKKGYEGDPEFWDIIRHAFMQCIRAIHGTYSCRMIIVGGRGGGDLNLYLGDANPPCPVVPAKLGADAGLYGAALLGFSAADEDAKDWDE